MAPFYGWGSTASGLEPFWGGSLLFITKFPEIPGTHFIDLGRMKGWVDLGATQWFWTREPWIGNPASKPLVHIRENIDTILTQTEKLRLFCWRLRGRVHYNLAYLLWSYVGSLKLFRERWHHKLGPKQSLAIFFFQKKLVLWKKNVHSEPNKHASLFKSNIFVYMTGNCC